MRTRIIENEFIESKDKFELYSIGLKYLGKIRLEFDPEMREFNEKRKTDFVLNGEKSELFGKSYDKTFNPNFETVYSQNLKEYKADFSQASDKAFIQDEIERLESIKATLRKCLKDDFETPEWKAIGAYCEYLYGLTIPKVTEKETIKPFIDYLKHDNKPELMKVLHEKIDGDRKGQFVAVIIRALIELKIMSEIPDGKRTKLWSSMKIEFNNIASNTSLNRYINTNSSVENSLKKEISTMVDFLSKIE